MLILTEKVGTMRKVHDSLRRSGLTDDQVSRAVIFMQNSGIFFREVAEVPTRRRQYRFWIAFSFVLGAFLLDGIRYHAWIHDLTFMCFIFAWVLVTERLIPSFKNKEIDGKR